MLLQKIWMYFGLFYLSLAAAIVFCFLKKKKIVMVVVILAGLFFSFKTYFNLIGEFGCFRDFGESKEEKKGRVSSGQTDFLKEIENLFGNNDVICYPWPSDIAGRFARQYFYPIEVELSPKKISNCNFLVLDNCATKRKYSIEKQLNDNDQLIYNSNFGKVYRIK